MKGFGRFPSQCNRLYVSGYVQKVKTPDPDWQQNRGPAPPQ
jgi:hypothetical protein